VATSKDTTAGSSDRYSILGGSVQNVVASVSPTAKEKERLQRKLYHLGQRGSNRRPGYHHRYFSLWNLSAVYHCANHITINGLTLDRSV